MQEMLDEIHRRNRDRSEQDQRHAPAAGPQVGIFWELNGALFIEGVSLTEAESWGQFKNYPGSHEKMWRKYQRIDAVVRDLEYDAPPRGRVVYDTAGQHFHLTPTFAFFETKRWWLRSAAICIYRRKLRPLQMTTTGARNAWLHHRATRIYDIKTTPKAWLRPKPSRLHLSHQVVNRIGDLVLS